MMNDVEAISDKIDAAGCQLFVLMYCGRKGDSLNSLRYTKYMELVTSSKKIESQKLPPTARAYFICSS